MSVVTVREILHNTQEMLGKTVTLKGWVRTARDVKACAFVELNDGSTVSNLQVVYDFTAEEWRILGARQGIDDSGMADKELRLLKPGDEITTVWYLSDWSEDSGFEAYESETLTVTADTAFYEQALPDGEYLMIFEMRDSQGNSAYSQGVGFTVDGEDITTSVYE